MSLARCIGRFEVFSTRLLSILLSRRCAKSPVRASSPPFLLIHGARDELVPLEQSRALQRELVRANIEARLIVVPDKGHWFCLDKNQMAEVTNFLQKHFCR